MENMIEAINLQKKFGNLNVLNGVSFTLKKGEVIAAIGPSGSGKSTMLRSLIDLEKIDNGSIIIEGDYICKDGNYSPEKLLKPIRKKMGMVFQHFNLFPHMTVKENLVVSPKLSKSYNKDEINNLCVLNLKKVGLIDKIDEYPSKLSGGQKQRVAIARALMMNPDILLFDEPTSALDPELTQEVLQVILDLAKENMTMIIVTHEMKFARDAASKILFLNDGVILSEGTPEEIMDNSPHQRIKDFLQSVSY